jgi:PTH1 family peptidyl-tRNA hydrolase
MEQNETIYLIAGLGNPGLAYRQTRHNFGFMALDLLTHDLDIPMKRVKFKAMIGEGSLAGKKIVFAKPLTFMNDSGSAIAPLLRYFKVPLAHLLVIHDDLDLPLGTLRIRQSGGTGGQRGMASIINRLGTQDFARMRLGIGRPNGQMDPVDYVLQHFSKSEEPLKEIVLKEAVEAARFFITDGLTTAMNKFNGDAN